MMVAANIRLRKGHGKFYILGPSSPPDSELDSYTDTDPNCWLDPKSSLLQSELESTSNCRHKEYRQPQTCSKYLPQGPSLGSRLPFPRMCLSKRPLETLLSLELC